jgi:hypothetical protein
MQIFKYLGNNYVLVAFSLFLLVPNFTPTHLTSLSDKGQTWEKFDPQLANTLQTVDDLIFYTDSVAKTRRIDTGMLDYANVLAEVMRKRFYHGYSHYSLKENWIASLAGVVLWDHLSAIVLPEDILKYPMAACSQQSIVFMECFKRRKVDYRKVGFDHHFALEGRINGQWYFFDADMEPDFTVVPRTSFENLNKDDKLYIIYQNRLDSAGIRYGLANQYYGKANQAPASRAAFFHKVTKLLSHTLWLLPLLFVFINLSRKNSQVKKKQEKKNFAAEDYA